MAIYDLPREKARALSVTDSNYLTARNMSVAEGAGGGSDTKVGQQNGYYYIWRAGIWFPAYELPGGMGLLNARFKINMKQEEQVGKATVTDWYLQLRKTTNLTNGTLEESKSDYPKMITGDLINTYYVGGMSTAYAFHYIDVPLQFIDLSQITIVSMVSANDYNAVPPATDTNERIQSMIDETTCFMELTYDRIPTVITNPATDITISSAILNGTLDDGGDEICDCGFKWGETEALGETTGTEKKTIGQDFSQTISGLQDNITYYFRAFAIHSVGTYYGEILSFTTIATSDVSDIITLEAFRNIEMSAMGRIYIDESGNLKYESRYARNL